MGEAHRDELVGVIREVRNRWRLKLAVRGLLVVAAGSILAFLLSARGLEAFRFSAGSVVAFRILIFAIFAALAGYWLVLPLRRRVSDSQVALYLEEFDPSLEAALLSAVEATSGESTYPSHSPALVERLVADAVEKCRAAEHNRRIEHAAMVRHVATLGAIAAVAALLVAFGPDYFRHGLSALFVLSQSAKAASPYHIEVFPGDTTVPRGSDQTITAKISGFEAGSAELLMRSSPNGDFERVPLVPASTPDTFEGILFHVADPIDYYVEAMGVRSDRYRMSLVDLPAVGKLDLEYRFPAYSGLEPQKVEDGGDVAALKGTEVALWITSTMKTTGGRILLNENDSAPLAVSADGLSLTGSFTIEQQGFYRIELQGPNGEPIAASPQYTIDALADQPPTVTFSKPGRDTQASPVEEVFAEVHAEDDFGIKAVELVYSTNGGPEKTVQLFGGSQTLPDVQAGHTIYLEELELEPGDFVSYYARATDTNAVDGAKTTMSDIYFVQIRPFRTDYRAAQSAAGMGGGGAGNEVGALSQQQRQIVAATFNTVRDQPTTTKEKYREDVVFLTLTQSRLREQVDDLVEKMSSRLVNQDPRFERIAKLLPQASEAMKAAEGELRDQQAKDALAPEQKALQLLQQAEQEYEVQVSQSRGGGGGGGGNQQLQDELAELFEMEMDKLANQYEMQNRAQQQSADQQIDELAERLKELARRQQQEAERQRRLAQGAQNASGTGASQRALAEEIENAARQLEQLTRDRPQQRELADVAQQLRQAAEEMRRAAANGSQDGGAAATQAQERLREAQERLSQLQSGRGERDIQNALDRADELAREQDQIENDVRALDGAGADRQSQAMGIAQRKDQMESDVADLENELQKLADGTRRDARDASRRLQEAANSIGSNKVKEKIRYSKGLLQAGGQNPEFARGFEESIGADLDSVRDKVAEAQRALGESQQEDAMRRAAEQASNLRRGVESFGERLRQQAQQGRQGNQQGQAGQQGQDQQGQQSQQGQQGQEGQQGGQQGQQGQQGGQQGQQGGQQGGQLNAGGAYAGGAYAGGDARNWYGYGWSDEDIRQWSRQAREWQGDAEALRRTLAESGYDVRDLDAIIRDLRRLQDGSAYTNPEGLAVLQAQALDKLKEFEFDLRKELGMDGQQQLFLAGSDEAPAGFRSAIEEYYRALAKK